MKSSSYYTRQGGAWMWMCHSMAITPNAFFYA